MKPLPRNIETERAVIAAAFLNPKHIVHLQKIIKPEDFYSTAHVHICEALFELKKDSTLITVSNLLKKNKLLEVCGGDDYLAGIVELAVTSAGYSHHALIVKALSDRRTVFSFCTVAAEGAGEIFTDTQEVLSTLKSSIRELEGGQVSKIQTNREIYMGIMDDLEKGSDDYTVGALTGLKNIDDKLNGLEPKTTYCLIAESGMAKSSLALTIADYVSLNYPGTVLYFTLESTNTALGRRQLARHSHIALTRLRNRNIHSDWEWENLNKACNILCEPNLMLIDDIEYQNIEKLYGFCESLAMDEKINLVVIDYIQLMDSLKRFNSRHLEISYISKQINFLAKELNVPILVISQLGKDVEKRNRKEPMLSDIKESGDIRNNMDNIISIYTATPETATFYAKIRCLKGKDVGRWTTWLSFNGHYQEFKDCEDQDDIPTQDSFSY